MIGHLPALVALRRAQRKVKAVPPEAAQYDSERLGLASSRHGTRVSRADQTLTRPAVAVGVTRETRPGRPATAIGGLESEPHTHLEVRSLTVHLGREVGAVEVAHVLRVGLLGRGAEHVREEILARRGAAHGREHARGARQRAQRRRQRARPQPGVVHEHLDLARRTQDGGRVEGLQPHTREPFGQEQP
eukprot:scaffold82897_cov68-Phaeocystis_antarctica.AAC.2